jgi:hypothetical protein
VHLVFSEAILGRQLPGEAATRNDDAPNATVDKRFQDRMTLMVEPAKETTKPAGSGDWPMCRQVIPVAKLRVRDRPETEIALYHLDEIETGLPLPAVRQVIERGQQVITQEQEHQGPSRHRNPDRPNSFGARIIEVDGENGEVEFMREFSQHLQMTAANGIRGPHLVIKDRYRLLHLGWMSAYRANLAADWDSAR